MGWFRHEPKKTPPFFSLSGCGFLISNLVFPTSPKFPGHMGYSSPFQPSVPPEQGARRRKKATCPGSQNITDDAKDPLRYRLSAFKVRLGRCRQGPTHRGFGAVFSFFLPTLFTYFILVFLFCFLFFLFSHHRRRENPIRYVDGANLGVSNPMVFVRCRA